MILLLIDMNLFYYNKMVKMLFKKFQIKIYLLIIKLMLVLHKLMDIACHFVNHYQHMEMNLF